MAIKNILRMGDPRLLQICKPVSEFDTKDLHNLVQDMLDTMEAEDGAGLAAIQIGIPLRIVVFGIENNPRYPESEPVPLTVLVNPEITILSDDMDEAWEGCLSVPGMRGMVPRYTHLNYKGSDQYGNQIDRTVSGFHARVIQHECDHLDGILYPMRINDFSKFGFIEELSQSGAMDNGTLPCETKYPDN